MAASGRLRSWLIALHAAADSGTCSPCGGKCSYYSLVDTWRASWSRPEPALDHEVSLVH